MPSHRAKPIKLTHTDPLPCPFCGACGGALDVGDPGSCDGLTYVECRTCHALGPNGNGKEGAIAVWNGRAIVADRDALSPMLKGV